MPVILLSAIIFSAEPITEKNWVTHPDIVAVRSLYQKVKEAKEAGRLKKTERVFEYCEPYEDTNRALYVQSDGIPRIYEYEGG